MNRIEILKTMAPGFLPLIIFIVADAIWGVKIGLVVAVVFGILEFTYTYLRDKVVDKFLLLDLGLIVVLGIVSLLLDKPVFFKLKPALIELIFCIILGISVFSPVNVMMMMTRRYMKNLKMDQSKLQQLKKSMAVLFYLFIFHTVLIVISAIWMSHAAWAFVSGGLFYIIFVLYLALEFLKNKREKSRWQDQYQDDEWFDIVDEDGNIQGRAPRSVCHSRPGLLHPVVHVHLIDQKDRIILQRRAGHKQIQPGKWDTAIGGHISSGETLKAALKREAEEELGIRQLSPVFVKKYKWESEIESELVFMFYSRYNGPLVFNREEVSEARPFRIKKIREMAKQGVLTPNFIFEFEILLKEVLR